MPSLTTSNCNMNTSSQQDKFLLKKTNLAIPTTQQYNNNNYTHSNLSCDNLKPIHGNHHHHHHVRRLSTLDCYTLKNEIVKLNPKSSVCTI